MAECVYCRSSTELYSNGTPVCIQCANAPRNASLDPEKLRALTLREIEEATEKTRIARLAFAEIMKEVPSGIPSPDGTQKVRNAARALALAREELINAHSRLTALDRRLNGSDPGSED